MDVKASAEVVCIPYALCPCLSPSTLCSCPLHTLFLSLPLHALFLSPAHSVPVSPPPRSVPVPCTLCPCLSPFTLCSCPMHTLFLSLPLHAPFLSPNPLHALFYPCPPHLPPLPLPARHRGGVHVSDGQLLAAPAPGRGRRISVGMHQAEEGASTLTARADREAVTLWELVWTSPVHAHYGGPYNDWLYTSPGIKPGFKKKSILFTPSNLYLPQSPPPSPSRSLDPPQHPHALPPLDLPQQSALTRPHSTSCTAAHLRCFNATKSTVWSVMTKPRASQEGRQS